MELMNLAKVCTNRTEFDSGGNPYVPNGVIISLGTHILVQTLIVDTAILANPKIETATG